MSIVDAFPDLTVPAKLVKWPVVDRVRDTGSGPAVVKSGTMKQCVERFLKMPIVELHLFEIHVGTVVLHAKQITDLAISARLI